jgi:hypothetical protein
MDAKVNFALILDKPIWIDPTLNVMDREIIQLADIAAYSAARYVMSGTAPTDPCFMWDQIRPCLATHFQRGCLEDAGFTISPRPATYPPGL